MRDRNEALPQLMRARPRQTGCSPLMPTEKWRSASKVPNVGGKDLHQQSYDFSSIYGDLSQKGIRSQAKQTTPLKNVSAFAVITHFQVVEHLYSHTYTTPQPKELTAALTLVRSPSQSVLTSSQIQI